MSRIMYKPDKWKRLPAVERLTGKGELLLQAFFPAGFDVIAQQRPSFILELKWKSSFLFFAGISLDILAVTVGSFKSSVAFLIIVLLR